MIKCDGHTAAGFFFVALSLSKAVFSLRPFEGKKNRRVNPQPYEKIAEQLSNFFKETHNLSIISLMILFPPAQTQAVPTPCFFLDLSLPFAFSCS